MQLKQLHKKLDELHKLYGAPSLTSIYGAGCIKNPKIIFAFGNQVSSILLGKPIKVSAYEGNPPTGGKEVLKISGKTFDVYPIYYPVGQGRKNMFRAIERMKLINANNLQS